MDAFEKFIMSDAFFPVLLLVLISLVGVFMWVLLSGKRNMKKNQSKSVDIENQDGNKENEYSVEVIESSSLEQENDKNEEYLNEHVFTLPDEAEEKEEIKEELPDLNGGDENVPVIENIEPVVEEKVEETHENEIQLPNEVENIEISEENKIDETENIELPTVKEDETEEEIIPEDDAFSITPDGNTEIKEDIEVPLVSEYTGEKTEIFDFPDFNEKTIEMEAIKKDVDGDVLKAANAYIESIMKAGE